MYVTAVWDGSAKDMNDELRFKRRIIIVNAVRTAILFFFFGMALADGKESPTHHI